MTHHDLILVVDDTSDSLALLGQLLTNAGFLVRLADSGELALAAATAHPPDLILLDLRMPGVDGLEVCRRLKARPETCLVPVILLSAAADANDWAEGLRLGAADFIPKPCQPEELLNRVRTQLALRHAGHARQEMLALRQLNEQLESEIARRLQTEASLSEANRALHAVSECNRAVVRATDESDLLNQACRIIVQIGGYRSAWIGSADQDDAKTIRPIAHAGTGEEALTCQLLTWANTEQGNTPVATAIRTGQPCRVADLAVDTPFSSWRQTAMRRCCASVAAFPLKSDQLVFAALNVCSDRADAFGSAEFALLSGMTDTLAHGILSLRERGERRRAQDQISATLESIGDGFLALDADWRFLYVNAAAELLLGIRRQDVLGRTHWEAFPDALGTQLEIEFRRAANGEIRDFENFHAPWSRWFHNRCYPRDGGGMSVYFQDVTARKRAEQALRDSENRFRAYVEQAADAIFVHDFEGRFLDVNQQACLSLGYSRQELLGMSVLDVETDFDLPQAQNAWNQFRSGQSTTLHGHHRRKNGTTFPVEVRFGCFDLEGARRFLGLARDVSDRERAQRELHESESHRTLALDAAHAGTWEWELATGKNVWSDKLWKLYGLAPHSREASYAAWCETIHPDDRAQVLRSLQEIVGREAELSLEWRVRDAAGTDRWLMAHGRPQRDAADRVSRYLGVVMDITEHKRLELQARRWEKVFDSVGFGMAYADVASNTFIDVNSVFARERGYTREELLGRSLLDVFAPEARAAQAARIPSVDQSGHMTFESVHQRKDGSTFPVFLEVTVIMDSAGRPLSRVACALDITERKRAEEALRLSEEKLSRIFTNNPAAIALTHLETGVVVDVNDAWVALTGYRREEIVGRSARALGIWPSADAARNFLDELKTHGSLSGREQEFRHKSGQLYSVQFSAVILNIQDEPLILSTLVDTTARRRAEDELNRSRKTFEAALASMTDAVFISDLQGRFVDFNDAFATFHRFRNKADCARTLADYPEFLEVFLPNGDLAPLEQWAVPRALRGESATNAQFTLHRKDTGQSWAGSYSFAPIRDQDGAIVGSVVVARDITDQKRAHEALQRQNEELTRFTYTVSHDLKSPLVTIRTFLGYLEKDLQNNKPEQVATDLGHMRRAATKMSELLEELLELSRVGRKMNPPEDVSLQALVDEAIDQVAGAIAENRVQIIITNTPVILHGDRRRLLEVFQNLLDNAVKFMGDQPNPRIEVGIEPFGAELALFVRDNGVGIDPRHKAKLFGLFEKLHPDTPGTGIGLALVKRIIEVHGGHIWAESLGPGQGATFYFTLGEVKQLKSDTTANPPTLC